MYVYARKSVCSYVHICVHVFVCPCMHACMHGWMHGCMDVRMYNCYVCTYVRMSVCSHVCIFAGLSACMYACLHVHTYVCSCRQWRQFLTCFCGFGVWRRLQAQLRVLRGVLETASWALKWVPASAEPISAHKLVSRVSTWDIARWWLHAMCLRDALQGRSPKS